MITTINLITISIISYSYIFFSTLAIYCSGHVWMWELDCEESWALKNWCFGWCWRRLLRVPWTARRPNQSILKEISPGYSLEGMMLKLKLQYMDTSCEELTHWKRLWCWEGLGAGGEGMTKDEMAGWHHWLDGHEVEWTPGVGDGQGGLACCDLWGRKELDTTEWLNWTELKKNFKINSSNHPSFYSVHRRGSWVSQQVKRCTMHYFKTISEPANFSLNINHVIKMKFMILHSEEKEIT